MTDLCESCGDAPATVMTARRTVRPSFECATCAVALDQPDREAARQVELLRQKQTLLALLVRIAPGAARAWEKGAPLPEHGYYSDSPGSQRSHVLPGDAQPDAMLDALGPVMSFLAFVEADAELAGQPHEDEAAVCAVNVAGGSTRLTMGHLRALRKALG
jgi:hypothetical protein